MSISRRSILASATAAMVSAALGACTRTAGKLPTLGLILPPDKREIPEEAVAMYGQQLRFVAAGLGIERMTLVPPPRMHLTRYHGVFAPHSKLRAAVTPAHRGIGAPKQLVSSADDEKPQTPRHVGMNWARRLKRVFGIDIENCARCGGKLQVIASIEEPEVIAKILAHLQQAAPDQYQPALPLGARAPPNQPALL